MSVLEASLMRYLFVAILLLAPVHAQTIFESAATGKLPAVRNAVESNRTLLKETDEQSRTLLHHAAANGRNRVVRYLLDTGAKPDPKDDNGETPLVLAVRHKKFTVAQQLMQHGAYAKLVYGDDQRTLLHEAVLTKSRGMVSLMLDAGINVKAQAEGHGTALHLAADQGPVELVLVLRLGGAQYNAQGSRGETPLHRAAAAGHFALVKYMAREGAHADARDNGGQTPGDWAQEAGHSDVAKWLNGYPESDATR